MARVLYCKCLWEENAADAVRRKDLEKAKELVDIADENIRELQELNSVWRQTWEITNKPYGFEVVDGRLGWMISRFISAREKMKEFSSGKRNNIEELSDKKLPYLIREGVYYEQRYWNNIVSVGYLK